MCYRVFALKEWIIRYHNYGALFWMLFHKTQQIYNYCHCIISPSNMIDLTAKTFSLCECWPDFLKNQQRRWYVLTAGDVNHFRLRTLAPSLNDANFRMICEQMTVLLCEFIYFSGASNIFSNFASLDPI